MAPLPAANAGEALQQNWDGAPQPWLPDPAALAQPHWQLAQPVCGMTGQPPAHEPFPTDRPPLRPVSACSTPTVVTSPAYNHIVPMQPASGDAWQQQAAPLRPSIITSRGAVHPEISGAGDGLPACDVDQSAADHRLMHQPSFAAWVPPEGLPGGEIAPMGVPAGGDMSQCCLGPAIADSLSVGQALTAKYSGALGMPPAQRVSQDLQTAAAMQPQIGQPAQQMEQPSYSQQAHQQMQQRRAGERGFLPPLGASLTGNEDSLCAFLGGWQRSGTVQQQKSGLGRPSEPSHAAGPPSSCGQMPVTHAGGRLLAQAPPSSQSQHLHPADEAQAAAAQTVPSRASSAAVPAQVDPASLIAPPAAAVNAPSGAAAAAQRLRLQDEPRTTASQPKLPAAAAADQLMHAEGEDFWRSLLSVVKDYKGEGRRGKGLRPFVPPIVTALLLPSDVASRADAEPC